MKIKTLTWFLLVAGLFAFTKASAEQLYILFDPSCMDRLEYEQGRTDYLAYHVNVRAGEKLILEVGPESANEQNYPPSPSYTCGNGIFDQALMRRINANIDEVFIVYPKNERRYTVSPVKMAAYYTKAGSVITYDSPKYRLRFDTEYGTIGENIAYNNPGVKLYFEGQMPNDCEGSYLFRQLAPESANPLTDLVLTPEIGITEERAGANADAAMDNAIVLDKVNGKSYARYLEEVCGAEPGSIRSQLTANSPVDYANQPTPAPAGSVGLPAGAQPISASNTTPVIMTESTVARGVATETAAAEQQTPHSHTVKDGETLYGISRQYGVTVTDIKNWNNLNSNLIRRGQVLQVTPPAATTNTATTAATAVGGELAARSPNATSVPVPYETTADSEGTFHIVRAGETVASLALRYGYTESRFREINNLGPNDYIRVGQRLRTDHCYPTATATTATTSVPAAPTTTTARTPGTTPSSYSSIPNQLSTANTAAANIPNSYDQPMMSEVSGARINTTAVSDQLQARSPAASTATTSTGSRNVAPNEIYSAIIPKAYSNTPASQPTATALQNPAVSPRTPASYSTPVPRGDVPSSYDYTGGATQEYNGTLPSRPDSYYRQSSNQRRVHIVQEGETLYSIASRYGTTSDKLRQINDMEANAVILPYQTIYIE
ncbi:MAG: LysM peptidoglycan-binding domain-containing protein [Lewinella sp.]|nr:LysM peptidoglycan-binding domain-containing protein [Lewinella sp.]